MSSVEAQRLVVDLMKIRGYMIQCKFLQITPQSKKEEQEQRLEKYLEAFK